MGSNRNGSRLKQRLARMFKPSSLLRSSCNTTTTSAATILSSTASSRTLLHDVACEPVFVPRRHRHRRGDDDGMILAPADSLGRTPSFSIANGRHHVAPVLPLSLDCGGCRPTRNHPRPLVAKREKGRHGRNEKTERRVRDTGGFYVTGEGEGKMCPLVFPSSPSKSSYYYYCFNQVEKAEKKKEKNKKKKKFTSFRFSTSSVDSDDGYEFFTSENGEGKEEETETFFSSRSFSSDSTEFYQRPTSNANKKKNKKKASRCPPRRISKIHENRNASEGFRPLISIDSREKEAKEWQEEEKRGFPVVKRSTDPYGDFRSSMVEMIIEKQIFGAEDFESLLLSYLFLNSPHHHPIILQAFSDICGVLFGY